MFAANKIRKFVFSIFAMCASVGAANATTITGTFNSASYQTISLNVAAASTVDLQYLGGYYDSNFVLFNGANNHIISNDDAGSSLFSHITQNLAAGNYTLLVTYCCNAVNSVGTSGGAFSGTDGFNTGSYWIGGSATLSSVEASLNVQPFAGASGMEFTIEVNNAIVDPGQPAAVPEPQSLALFGLALVALSLTRRRQFGSK